MLLEYFEIQFNKQNAIIDITNSFIFVYIYN